MGENLIRDLEVILKKDSKKSPVRIEYERVNEIVSIYLYKKRFFRRKVIAHIILNERVTMANIYNHDSSIEKDIKEVLIKNNYSFYYYLIDKS